MLLTLEFGFLGITISVVGKLGDDWKTKRRPRECDQCINRIAKLISVLSQIRLVKWVIPRSRFVGPGPLGQLPDTVWFRPKTAPRLFDVYFVYACLQERVIKGTPLSKIPELLE